jgi:hypothetical protein
MMFKKTVITSWADCGIEPDFNPGRWVQLGHPTMLNFFLTGLPGGKFYVTKNFPYIEYHPSKTPFKNHKSTMVDKNQLEWPRGFGVDGFVKGLLGQRKIK